MEESMMTRKQVYTGLYTCPICEDEFELFRASDAELLCPICCERLEPVLAKATNHEVVEDDEE